MAFKDRTEQIKHWNGQAKKALVGKKIVKAEYTKDEEFGEILVIVLEDGTNIFPMADDEGNGPGSLSLAGNPDNITCLPVMY